MHDLTVSGMLDMQNQLFELHAHEWQKRIPRTAPFQLLWAVDELGEVITIIKKKGSSAVMENEAVRDHFVEEMDDVLMYLFDTMQCLGIDEADISKAYLKKYESSQNISDISLSQMMDFEKMKREKALLGNLPDHNDCAFRLFSVVEAIGALGSVLRTNGADNVSQNSDIKSIFLERTVDVFASLCDVAISMGVTADELSQRYERKFDYNMHRDWHSQNKKLYEDK